MTKNIILQGGSIKCPICGNAFKWSYKLELIRTSDLDAMNKRATIISCTPHNYITHIVTADENVRFSIGCERCAANIETEPMELINSENFEKNKKL